MAVDLPEFFAGLDKNDSLELSKFINERKGICAFDFDKTLIQNDFGEAVMEELIMDGLKELREPFADFFQDKTKAEEAFKKRFTNPEKLREFIWSEYETHAGGETDEPAYRWTSFLFSGWMPTGLSEFSRHVWDKHLTDRSNPKSVSIIPQMREFVYWLKKKDWDCIIVTASPSICIREVSAELGIPAEKVFGMNMELINGRSTSKIIEPYPCGEGKTDVFKSNLGKNPDLSVGDSRNDFHLLANSIKGLLIDRGNRGLEEKCRKAGIWIHKGY